MKAVVARLDGSNVLLRNIGEGRADPNVPSIRLKIAADLMKISEGAALKRAQRGWRRGDPAFARFRGVWHFSPAYIQREAVSRSAE